MKRQRIMREGRWGPVHFSFPASSESLCEVDLNQSRRVAHVDDDPPENARVCRICNARFQARYAWGKERA